MVHVLEQHPQKQKAIDLILAGDSVRSIAAQLDPPVSFQAVQRYRKSIVRPVMTRSAVLARVLGKDVVHTNEGLADAAMETAKAVASEALQARQVVDPYLARTAQHRQTVDIALADAALAKDGRTVAALVGVDLKGLELDARLTGRLDTAQGTTNNFYIVSPMVTLSAPARPAAQVVDVTPVDSSTT